MFKKASNWHISILIIIVSVLSISLVQKYVYAQWQEPSTLPGVSASRNIVVSPMTSSLNLNGQSLMGDNITIDSNGSTVIDVKNGGQICFDGTDCSSNWPTGVDTDWTESGGNVYRSSGYVGIGTNAPTQLLQVSGGNILLDNNQSIKQLGSGGSEYSVFYLNSSDVLNLAGNNLNVKDLSGNSLFFVEDMGSVGYVGIGTTSPNKNLHIFSEGANAEMDIQSGSALTHWGIYQDSSNSDLKFWNGDNRVVFSDSGYVGIGVANPTSQLHVESTDQNAVYAKTALAGKYAVYAENSGFGGTGIYGMGYFGAAVSSNNLGGAGILAMKGSGSYSGMFFGPLRLYNSGADLGYLHLAVTDTDPPASDCDSVDERGRMIYNYVGNYLYICDYDPADPASAGRKINLDQAIVQ